ncbi:MAG: adenosylhomocysteinase [Aigarchaeota archaeon]|nr:adenosylhomocysteinase [Candidatus Pelearchaeum maunauluense]
MRGYWIRDESLAEQGRRKIEWAEAQMPVLRMVREELSASRELEGVRVSACLHITKETAVLVRALRAGGAEIALCASNPLSTQDEVAAALAAEGIHVYGFRGMNHEEYYRCIGLALSHSPTYTVDDGADLVTSIHKIRLNRLDEAAALVKSVVGDVARLADVRGGTEETTTGVTRLRTMAEERLLLYPIIAVNDARSKSLFDNPIGTGQSALDGILRATNLLIAGKNVVVCGFGRVGEGIAERARGLAAHVTVVEPDPIKALKAYMSGFRVDSMKNAARYGDVFITATGNINVIRGEHFNVMKDGAVLANAGHMDVEIAKDELRKLAVGVEEIRPCLERYTLNDGRRIYLLGEGRLVNLVCAEGHPSEVMDLSFSLQAESIRYLNRLDGKLETRVHLVPEEVDRRVARLKLKSLDVELEELTEEQLRYMREWAMGT